jgi:hypothetical protein
MSQSSSATQASYSAVPCAGGEERKRAGLAAWISWRILRESPAAATVVAPYWPGKAWFRELLTLVGDYRLIGTAAALADQQYLSRFKLRPPGAWPVVTFVIRA